jgi:hypothetical protein
MMLEPRTFHGPVKPQDFAQAHIVAIIPRPILVQFQIESISVR